ncbi:zinc metalloprotease [Microbotryomycetes sp. JL221]|nr:zinc metalloprotease [Microbotryomycetes sp. JL221]
MSAALQQVQQRLDDVTIPWQQWIVGTLAAVTLFELYINTRQRPYLSPRLYPKLPEALQPFLPASTAHSTYAKSQHYTRDKLNWSTLTTILDLIESILLLTNVTAPLLTRFGIDLGQPKHVTWSHLTLSPTAPLHSKLLSYIGLGPTEDTNWTLLKGFWNLAASTVPPFATSTTLRHSLSFVVLMSFVSLVTSVPKSLYSTFVIEQRHGFNKTTLSTFVSDTLKGLLVSIAIEVPLVAAILAIIDRVGGQGGIIKLVTWLLLLIFAFQLVMIPLYPFVIAPLFNKFSPLPQDSPFYPKVKDLSSKLDFPLGNVYVIDGSKRSSHSNAYAYGIPGLAKHIVLYDTLLEKSTPDEVEAVLAHELGHSIENHIVVLLFASLVQTAVSLLTFSLLLFNKSLLSSFGFHQKDLITLSKDAGPTIVSLLLASILAAPVSTVLHFIMNVVSRKLEYDADKFAAKLGSKVAQNLKVALASLHEKNLALTLTDGVYSAFHNNHPTLIERLDALDKLIDEQEKQVDTKKNK